MDLSDLRCLVAVADELHFGRAAQRLVYTKSHVSQIVARLERELGLTLFNRSTRRVALTPAGTAILAKARAVLDSVADLRREATNLAAQLGSQLRIAYAPGTGGITTRLVAELSTAVSPSAVQIEPKPSSPDVIRAVADGDVLVGIAQWTAPQLESAPLARPAPVLFVPAGHHLAAQDSVTLQELDHEALLLPGRDINPELYDATLAFFADRGIEPDYRPRHITSPAQVVELVSSRQGVAIATQGVAGSGDGLVAVPLVGPAPPGQTVYVLWRRGATATILKPILAIVGGLASGPG